MRSLAHNEHPSVPVEIEVFLLGGFRLRIGNSTTDGSSWRLSRAATLIQMLALEPGHQLHRDKIVDQFWPELDVEAGMNNFHQVLFVARRAIENMHPGIDGNVLLPLANHVVKLGSNGHVSSDVQRFEAMARVALKSRIASDLQQAIDRYTCDLLPGQQYDDTFSLLRERLRHMHESLLLNLASRYIAEQHVNQAIEVLLQVVASDPLHEEANIQLMLLYQQVGLRHRAIAQFRSLQRQMDLEFGLPPSVPVRDLYKLLVSDSTE